MIWTLASTADFAVQDVWFGRTVIRSRHELHYQQAQVQWQTAVAEWATEGERVQDQVQPGVQALGRVGLELGRSRGMGAQGGRRGRAYDAAGAKGGVGAKGGRRGRAYDDAGAKGGVGTEAGDADACGDAGTKGAVDTGEGWDTMHVQGGRKRSPGGRRSHGHGCRRGRRCWGAAAEGQACISVRTAVVSVLECEGTLVLQLKEVGSGMGW